MTSQEQDVYALVVGKSISLLRERQHLTQTKLAKAAGLTQSMLSRIERGQAQPEAFALEKLAGAFGLASSAALMGLFREVSQLAEQSAQCAIRREQKAPWWESALQVVGEAGISELVAFAVRVALADLPPTKSRQAAARA